jgi:AraC-like DNA-binding protein
VQEIARLIGFDEPGNFTHAFKRWAGLTPSAYRTAKAS